MQIEKIWGGFIPPHSVNERAKKIKGTYSEDAVVFEGEKNERQQKEEAPDQTQEDEKSTEEQQAKSEEKDLVHVDLIA